MKKTYKQQIKRVFAEENTGLSIEQVLEREQSGMDGLFSFCLTIMKRDNLISFY